jgi:hypothetical protein
LRRTRNHLVVGREAPARPVFQAATSVTSVALNTGFFTYRDLALIITRCSVSFPDTRFAAVASGARAAKGGVSDDRIRLMATGRLREELDGATLHRLYGRRNVTMRNDEDDRELGVCLRAIALTIRPDPSRFLKNLADLGLPPRDDSCADDVGHRHVRCCAHASRPQGCAPLPVEIACTDVAGR